MMPELQVVSRVYAATVKTQAIASFVKHVQQRLPGCTQAEAEKVFSIYRRSMVLEFSWDRLCYEIVDAYYWEEGVLQSTIDFDERFLG